MDAADQAPREKALFEQALDLASSAERLAFLHGACGEDGALLARVQALLQAHEADEGFLPEQPTGPVSFVPVSEKPGDRIGRYKLRERIGEGGCGVVYVAEQEEPVRRKVALKVIKLGMDTRNVVARFQAERQALALMDHPNIAQVHDAGATETGRPYFVMELVRGIKITDYCDQQRLSTRERLELFIKVCQAVQHAHQKGVIHRDLKPSNILVTVNDGAPAPKVIDFGIAKATEGKLTDLTVYTDLRQFIGTPAYMSPEQATMTSLDMDTRSDIYSLGVLLYELLTGHTPFDTKELMALGVDDLRRTILEKEPVRPSTRLSTMLEGELTTTAKQRASEPPRLIHQVRGDLDWIVMKCLEKDRARRYDTANGLIREIQRHLRNEPVLARPPSRVYEFQKTVRRHKVGFLAAAAVIVALGAGFSTSTFSYLRERDERSRAVAAETEQRQLRAQAQKAQAVEEQLRREAQAQESKALQNLYAADMSLAYQALDRGNLGHVRQLLAKYSAPKGPQAAKSAAGADPRGWEWRNLWKRARGDEATVLYGHSNVVTFAGVMADGRTVVSASHDRTVRFWDASNGLPLECVPYPDPVACGALSPDGRWLAIGDEGGHWSLWDTASRKLSFGRTNATPVRGVAFSPDSARLSVASVRTVEIWNVREFKLFRTIARKNRDFTMGMAFSADNNTVAYSQGEDIIATNALALCEVESGSVSVLGSCQVGGALALAFTADGRSLISAERSGISVWDLALRRPLILFTNIQCAALALSPDGTLLASAGGDQTVRLWDTRSWAEKRILLGHELEVLSVAFSRDGRKLVSCGKDEAVRVWDLERPPATDETYTCPPGWITMPPLPDLPRQLRIQIGNGGPTRIGFLNLSPCEEEATQLSPIPFAPNEIPDDVSGDLRRLAILRSNGSIEIWSTLPFVKVKVFAPSPAGTRSIALGRTGRWLAVERENSQVEILDLDQDRTVARLELSPAPRWSAGQYYPRLSFWARDTRLARVSQRSDDPNELIEVFSLPGMECRRIGLNHKDGLNNFALSSDGSILATTAWDAQIKLWNTMSGAEIHSIGGQLVGYISVALAPDGSRLVAGAWDGSVTLWDTSSWSQLAHWQAHPYYALGVGFTADGKALITRGAARRE